MVAQHRFSVTGPREVTDDQPCATAAAAHADFGALILPSATEHYRGVALTSLHHPDRHDSLLLTTATAQMILTAYAAPRSMGLADTILDADVTHALTIGGAEGVDYRHGPYGREAVLEYPALGHHTFIVVERPRWTLRVAIASAAGHEVSATLRAYSLLNTTLVRRGPHAQPPGTALTLHLPDDWEVTDATRCA